MPILRRARKAAPRPRTTTAVPSGTTPAAAAVKVPSPAPTPELKTSSAVKPSARETISSTRIAAVWVWLGIAVLALTAFIVFMVQNTQKVQVDFLWMSGTLPLDLALLIAGAIVGVITAIAGTARITRLRRIFQQRRTPSAGTSRQPPTPGQPGSSKDTSPQIS